jgi:hypothetical protein
MKYIKLFEDLSIDDLNTEGIESGDNVYVVKISATSGPDYGFEGFVFFRASNAEEAKENFGAQMLGEDWKETLNDKKIAIRHYKNFEEFIYDFLEDSYYEQWNISGHIYSIFPFKPFMKLKGPSGDENIINLYNEGWGDDEEEIIEGELEAMDEMSAMVGADEALDLFLTWKFGWEPNGTVTLSQKWKDTPYDYKVVLYKYNKNLPPDEVKAYKAAGIIKGRII